MEESSPVPPPAGEAAPRTGAAAKVDLADPALYLNRELSLLEFNRRVLAQAKDTGLPLLERLRFLTICTSNLDEFFEIRVAGLKQQVRFGASSQGPDGVSPLDVFQRVTRVAHDLVTEQYRLSREELLPALAEEGIRILKRTDLDQRQLRWVKQFFANEVKPVLTPIGLDPAHPFPMVLNKGLSFLVTVQGDDAYSRTAGIAVVQVPRSLPRLIGMPIKEKRRRAGQADLILLSSVIHSQMGELFRGMEVTGCHQFRVTRNSDLWVDEEEMENLMQALQGELSSRRFGDAVRIEVANDMPDRLCGLLLDKENLAEADLYRVNGPVNLHRMAAVYDQVERPDLKFRSFLPGTPRRLHAGEDIFATVRRGDILLHHPYQSFAPVVELLRQAAQDPDVLAIKQTLYRTDVGSPVVEALIKAAQAGKDVTALVELRARFDEAANIDLASRLQEVGANVVYGIVGYKAHAKMLLIIRREGKRLRRYVHLGTGNYHAKTARAYTDLGLITAARSFGEDVQALFDQLTGLGRATKMSRLLQSPFTLHKTLLKLIAAEAKAARQGKPARIIARMNSLSERDIIRSLYEASQAGVRIDLLVRGICCLRPGVEGVSENIRVRSVVDRFLEHSRVFFFHAAGDELLFASSADWMSRNLHRRVETCFPFKEARQRQRVLQETLELYLQDNTQAWLLGSDGRYRRAKPGKLPPFTAQVELLRRHAQYEVQAEP